MKNQKCFPFFLNFLIEFYFVFCIPLVSANFVTEYKFSLFSASKMLLLHSAKNSKFFYLPKFDYKPIHAHLNLQKLKFTLFWRFNFAQKWTFSLGKFGDICNFDHSEMSKMLNLAISEASKVPKQQFLYLKKLAKFIFSQFWKRCFDFTNNLSNVKNVEFTHCLLLLYPLSNFEKKNLTFFVKMRNLYVSPPYPINVQISSHQRPLMARKTATTS